VQSFRTQRVVPLAALALVACLVLAPGASAKKPKLKAKQQCQVIGGVPNAGIAFTGKGFTPGSLVDVTVSIEGATPGSPGTIDSFVITAGAKGRFGPFEAFGPAPLAAIRVTADSIFEDEVATLAVFTPCERSSRAR
jgi:hypothetical protein